MPSILGAASPLILKALKPFVIAAAAGALGAKLDSEARTAAVHLDAARHSFPTAPSDADRALFVHRAIFQLLKASGLHGTPAGIVRRFIQDRVIAQASPKLSAGLTTEQAARGVADAIAEVAKAEAAARL